jgi:hypothetical protein
MEQSVMVFGGTAARSSAIPTPSTGMTSYIGVTGTASIPQIETYTGSAWQTPYGLTQVANVSFTSANSIAIDNVFTTTYDHYEIILRLTAASATDDDLIMYGRTAGADVTTGWVSEQLSNTGTTVSATETTNARLGSYSSAYATFTQTRIRINSPRLATTTFYEVAGLFISSIGVPLARRITGYHSSTNQFDGFKVIPSSAVSTISGNIKIYGYRNS